MMRVSKISERKIHTKSILFTLISTIQQTLFFQHYIAAHKSGNNDR